jgi:NedA-like, galactose-binding domain/F5/8 type C domain
MIIGQDVAPPAPRVRDRVPIASRSVEGRPPGLPGFFPGLHDLGGELYMLAAGKPGWVVVSTRVNPPDSSGDYSSLAEKGLGVIVRLNNGYAEAGTIPNSSFYSRFAFQCAQFVARAKGARIWIIGNEPNAAGERPGNDGTENSGQVITPEMYASCLIRCRKAIRALPGHKNDWVIPAAIAPFNTQTSYPKNPSGDWVRYFADVLFQIQVQRGGLDGIALHTHTHGADAGLVASEAKSTGHFSGRHWHFRAYRDYLAAVPPSLRKLPVFITEAQPLEPGWTRENRNWIQAACSEINSWNSNLANQPIQAVCFFRWQSRPGDPTGWGMEDKREVIQDFSAALQNDYNARWPGVYPRPDHLLSSITTPFLAGTEVPVGEAIEGHVVLKNVGASSWDSTGTDAVRLGCRWLDIRNGASRPVAKPVYFHLSQDVLPGQSAVIEHIKVQAPSEPGPYLLSFDVAREVDPWPAEPDSSTNDLAITVTPPRFAAKWEQVFPLGDNPLETNKDLIGTVEVKNIGSSRWERGGANPVRLAYHWYDEHGHEAMVERYAGNFELSTDTPPTATARFQEVLLRSPSRESTYSLVWDLVKEGVACFSEKGVETSKQVVQVVRPRPDFAAGWTDVSNIPDALEPNETIHCRVSVRNLGVKSWNSVGENPVRLNLQWCDASGNPVADNLSKEEYDLTGDVPPGELATFEGVIAHAPIARGAYILLLDLVKEGITTFTAAGSPPHRSSIAVETYAPDYLAEWLQAPGTSEVPVHVGDTFCGRGSVKNSGTLVWECDGENRVGLGCCWYDASGQQVGEAVTLFPLVRTVLPREAVILENLQVRAPDEPGEYTLKWDLRGESAGWFETGGSTPLCIPIRVKPQPLDWGAEFVAHNTPACLAVGQETSVILQVRNAGKNTWPHEGANAVYAAYKWIDGTGNVILDAHDPHALLLGQIFPGELASFDAPLVAPIVPGAYRLQWDLAVEGISWFADGGSPPLILPVRITESPSGTNLWRAEASHNSTSAILAIDGDLASHWSSGANRSAKVWFRVNFGTPRLIDGISFRSPGSGYAFGYAVRVSPDGQAWRILTAVERGNTQDIVLTFPPQDVVEVQVDLLTAFEGEWSISEVQIHSAVRWNATASLNNERAPQAIDNDPDTCWTTEESQTPDMWFQIDLGRIETVSGLSLSAPADEIPRGYRISVWNQEAGAWQKIAERQNNEATVDISFAPVQTQYANVHLLQDAQEPWAIRQVRLTKAMTRWVGPNNV